MRFTLIAALFVVFAFTATTADETFSVAEALEEIISMIASRGGSTGGSRPSGFSAPKTGGFSAPKTGGASHPKISPPKTGGASFPKTQPKPTPKTGGVVAPKIGGHPKGPTTSPKGPTTPKGPVTTPKGPVTTPKGPHTTPKGPVTTPKGPVTTPKTPVTTPKGPTTTPKGPTTTPKTPVTTPKTPTTTPKTPTTPGKAPHMFQVDPRWANEYLGNSKTTIGKAGCAMSSVSAMLAAKGVKINGQDANPHTLNQYLKSNGGYSGALINWGAVKGLGFNYQGQITNKNQMVNDLKSGKNLILNVQNGGHWVLATGVTEKGFTVMNPGRSSPNDRNFYSFGEVVRASVYSNN